MAFITEKDWITAAGLRAVVFLVQDGSHRCGYVAVPVDHPLHGQEYQSPCVAIKPPGSDEPVGKRGLIPLLCAQVGEEGYLTSPDVAFDVHGSLTFSGGGGSYPASGDEWWFGFDCAHYLDAKSPEYYQKMREKYPDNPFMWDDGREGIFRSLDYCVTECESLARQIVERTALTQ